MAGNPHLDELIVVARRAGAGGGSATIPAWRCGCGGARFDLVLDLHGGPRSALADAGDRRAAADRLRYPGPALALHARSTAAGLRPRHSVVNQWDLLAAIDGWPGAAARIRRATPSRWRPTRTPTRGSTGGCATPASTRDDDADRRARQRGQPVPALAGAGVRPAGRRAWPPAAPPARSCSAPGRRIAAAARESRAAARAAARDRRAARIVDFGEFDLAELRALVARSRLFVGGDTGPLHIAATTATPVVGIYGPTLPARSAPWRDPRDPDRVGGSRGTALPAVRSAGVRAGRFSMPDDIDAGDVIAAAERAAERGARDRAGEHAAAGLERVGLLVAAGLRRRAAVLDRRRGAPARARRRCSGSRSSSRGRERIEVPRDVLAARGLRAASPSSSAVFSIDPQVSFSDSKQLLLFAIVPIAYRLLRGDAHAEGGRRHHHRRRASSAVYGIVQYGILNYDNLGQRVQGALGHYMTYSGLIMLVACIAAARVMFRQQDRLWAALIMPALLVALALTFSRNAWVGACAGIGTAVPAARLPAGRAAAGRRRRVHRLRAGASDRPLLLDVQHSTIQASSATTNRTSIEPDRLAMIRSGLRIIKDHPLTGVGPDMVIQVYPHYRDPQRRQAAEPAPAQRAAADRRRARAAGAGGLALVHRRAACATSSRRRRSARCPSLPTAALACVVAMLAAGMFEYNFGDSEFLMLFLVS